MTIFIRKLLNLYSPWFFIVEQFALIRKRKTLELFSSNVFPIEKILAKIFHIKEKLLFSVPCSITKKKIKIFPWYLKWKFKFQKLFNHSTKASLQGIYHFVFHFVLQEICINMGAFIRTLRSWIFMNILYNFYFF